MEKTPSEALDDFLEVLRREFRDNPEFALRAVKALGASIEFRGESAATLISPLELIEAKGVDSTKQTLSSFSANELKKIAKTHNLATPIDMKGLAAEGIVELLIQRASRKISERRG